MTTIRVRIAVVVDVKSHWQATVIYINGEPECGMCHEKQHLRVRER